ncbi:hypothetical protein TNCV_1511951 [Trichonephila clavipes]|nr:hypothetical protein TNCV_1511951 [Trichonephila clavipes]
MGCPSISVGELEGRLAKVKTNTIDNSQQPNKPQPLNLGPRITDMAETVVATPQFVCSRREVFLLSRGHRRERLLHVKSVEVQSHHVGLAWKFGDWVL